MLPKLIPIGLVMKVKVLAVDNADTILTGVGVTGAIATAVLTGQASFKAARLIDAERLEIGNKEGLELATDVELTKVDKVKLTWRLYLPAVGVGTTTVTSIIVANRLSAKKLAALALASGISERALSEYKAKVLEKFTDRQNETLRDEIAQDRINKFPASSQQIIIAGQGDVLCYDMLTGRYFKSSIEEIKKAENKVNYEIIHFMSASLSTFFEEIGLPPTTYTDMVGWNMNNQLEVKFSTVMSDDGRPCIAVDFTRPPISDYDKHWD